MNIAEKDSGKCQGCGFCEVEIACAGAKECTGCGACVSACPFEARKIVEIEDEEIPEVSVRVNGEAVGVPANSTVLKALDRCGYEISATPGYGDIYAPCRTGGCYSCAVLVDRKLKPSCITPVTEGMEILTDTSGVKPERVVSGFQGHPVGGVGTPHELKSQLGAIEVVCFAHGCILRCPTCQNWRITYSSASPVQTPEEAAKLMTSRRRKYAVDRMAISGGECTLNREWLLVYIEELNRLNQDRDARIHVDTNAVVLDKDYLDDLVNAGMSDLGIDVKGYRPETFSRITGIDDEDLTKILLENEWRSLEYAIEKHWPDLFVGVGVPYNPELISLEEVRRIGERIAEIDPRVQICGLDYRPEFRREGMIRPGMEEMLEVKRSLEEGGLECVICQTPRGHVGPD